MYIYKSTRKNKRYVAEFHDGLRVHFGAKDGSTYIDHQDPIKRENYIKRHSKLNENWDDYTAPGTLSRFLLWEYEDLPTAIKQYKKRFGIK